VQFGLIADLHPDMLPDGLERVRALVTLDLEHGDLVLEGRRTAWVGPDPWARGEITDRPREQLRPWISDRRLKIPSCR
jgi:hypothetical protein